jgi:hypothetical protein
MALMKLSELKWLEPNFLGPPKAGMVFTALFGTMIAALYSESLHMGVAGAGGLLAVLFFNFLHIGIACKITRYWLLRSPECATPWRQVGRIAWIAAVASLAASPIGMADARPEHWTLFAWAAKSLNGFAFTLAYALIETFVRVEVRRERALGEARRTTLAAERSDLAA